MKAKEIEYMRNMYKEQREKRKHDYESIVKQRSDMIHKEAEDIKK